MRSIDPLVPIGSIESYRGALADQLFMQRVAAQVLGLFASLTLLLAGIGIYGLLAYFVAQRTREIGIRLALGARDGQVMSLVMGRSLRLVAFGLLIGGVLAVLAAASLGEILLGIRATDPVALGGGALLLGAAGLFASWLPARRAMRIDPTLALRSE